MAWQPPGAVELHQQRDGARAHAKDIGHDGKPVAGLGTDHRLRGVRGARGLLQLFQYAGRVELRFAKKTVRRGVVMLGRA
jgi:hypothetical protein